MKQVYLIVSLLLMFFITGIEAQGDFKQLYEREESPFLMFNSMVWDADSSHVIIAGMAYHPELDNQGIYLGRMDTLGNVLHDTVLAETDNHYVFSRQYDIINGDEGGFVIAGQKFFGRTGLLINIFNNFKVKWQKDFVSDTVYLNVKNEDVIEVEGGYLMQAGKQHESGYQYPHLTKVDYTGNVLWERSWYDETKKTMRAHLSRQGDRILYVGGIVVKDGKWHRRLVILDSSGEQIHDKEIAVTENELMPVEIGYMDDKVILLGLTGLRGRDSLIYKQPMLRRVDKDLNIMWEYRYGDILYSYDSGIKSIARTHDGHYIASIEHYYVEEDKEYAKAIHIKFTADGEILWERRDQIDDEALGEEGSYEYPVANKTLVLPSGSIMTCGNVRRGISSVESQMGFLMKIDKNGCINGDCSGLLTSTEDHSLKKVIPIRVYPNPASDYIRLDGGVQSLVGHELSILDMAGGEVLHATLTDADVDISELKSGTYSYHIRDESGRLIWSDKVVVVK